MKTLKLIPLLFLSLILFSCTEAGTIRKLPEPEDSNIEVYRYFYADGCDVLIARFKDEPNIVTTKRKEGKQTNEQITIFENDSIQVILKK